MKLGCLTYLLGLLAAAGATVLGFKLINDGPAALAILCGLANFLAAALMMKSFRVIYDEEKSGKRATRIAFGAPLTHSPGSLAAMVGVLGFLLIGGAVLSLLGLIRK